MGKGAVWKITPLHAAFPLSLPPSPGAYFGKYIQRAAALRLLAESLSAHSGFICLKENT